MKYKVKEFTPYELNNHHYLLKVISILNESFRDGYFKFKVNYYRNSKGTIIYIFKHYVYVKPFKDSEGVWNIAYKTEKPYSELIEMIKRNANAYISYLKERGYFNNDGSINYERFK